MEYKQLKDYFLEFCKYLKKKSCEKIAYVYYYEVISLNNKSEYEKNSCLFLDENKIFKKFNEIISKFNLSEETTLDRINEKIKNISLIFDAVNIKEYIVNDVTLVYHVELLKKIATEVGKNNICELTIGDLKTYYKRVCTNYQLDIIKMFLENFYVDEKDKDNAIQNLNDWLEKNSDNIIKNKPGYFITPYSYITNKKCINFFLSGSKINIQNIDDRNIESSDIYDYPNIQIFCSTNDNLEEIKKYIFNRFIYLHEFAHNLTFNYNTKIKINGEIFMVPNQEQIINYKQIFETDLNLDLKDFLDKNELTDFYSTKKNSNIYYDLFADLLTTTVLTKELVNIDISINDILGIIIKIINELTPDASHLEKNMRTLINIYSNLELRNAYESLIPDIDKIKVDKIISNLEIIKKKVELKHKDFTDNIPNYNTETRAKQRQILNEYRDKNIDFRHLDNLKVYIEQTTFPADKKYYIDNINSKYNILEKYAKDDYEDFDKMLNFFKKIDNFTTQNEKIFYKKYLKYKTKYLQLKKLK